MAWTQKPGLPSASLFGVAPHEGGPEPQQQPAAAAAGGSGRVSVQEAAAAAAAATGQKVVVKKTVMQLPSHPQSAIGGHQMPTAGRIGGAKGVGTSDSSGDASKVGVSVLSVGRSGGGEKVRVMKGASAGVFCFLEVVDVQCRRLPPAAACTPSCLNDPDPQ